MDTNLLLPEQTQAFAKQQTWENKANLHFSLTTNEFKLQNLGKWC